MTFDYTPSTSMMRTNAPHKMGMTMPLILVRVSILRAELRFIMRLPASNNLYDYLLYSPVTTYIYYAFNTTPSSPGESTRSEAVSHVSNYHKLKMQFFTHRNELA